MKCIYCKGKTEVTKTLLQENKTTRYRKCKLCHRSFPTIETTYNNLSNIRYHIKSLKKTIEELYSILEE